MSTAIDVKSLIRPEVLAMNAYHVPDSTGFIKLDAMENPYRWPVSLIDEWLSTIRDVEFNRYPDPCAQKLQQILRRQAQIPDAAALLLGNGSDELIQIILMSLSGQTRPIMTVEPTFVMYRQIAQCLGLPCIGIPLREDFSLDRDKMLEVIHRQQPSVIFIAYPNNPTGNLFASSDLSEIITASSSGLVVIDEAYLPFAQTTFMQELLSHPNLLVMRTVSKFGLAGLRLGYLAGAKTWLEQFDKLRLPYNINILTQVTARFALLHEDVFNQQTASIRQAREKLYQELTSLDDVHAYPSHANFILFRLKRHDANLIFARIKQRGVLIKNLSGQGDLLHNCLRVTVGTPEDNEQFLHVLLHSLQEK